MSRIQEVTLTIVIVILLASHIQARRRRVDCTKFVFAPVCRGVAAKRANNHVYIADTLAQLAWKLRSPKSSEEFDLEQSPEKNTISLSELLGLLSKLESARKGTDSTSTRTEQDQSPNEENARLGLDSDWFAH